ncbi:hypothetical protein EXU57_12255 [Segetibacter sp. 3557_3]|uniref:hypothetical protein n=1 Tax=Segetibacter sp. 3557_3 TaxID=2547429 RepID=UPI0010585EC6|nr:hypothetical protein [Segetibacter sp. 3557_3]TDH26254.1 hypothetical protein EXU57_12255 [Segetibacter sp. 3557_3]
MLTGIFRNATGHFAKLLAPFKRHKPTADSLVESLEQFIVPDYLSAWYEGERACILVFDNAMHRLANCNLDPNYLNKPQIIWEV